MDDLMDESSEHADKSSKSISSRNSIAVAHEIMSPRSAQPALNRKNI